MTSGTVHLTSQPAPSSLGGNAPAADKELLIDQLHIMLNGEHDWPRQELWAAKLTNGVFLASLEYEKSRMTPEMGSRANVVAEFEFTCASYMCNAWGMTHGGFISTLLDIGNPALHARVSSLAATQSINVNFMSPAVKGDNLRAIARTRSGGKKRVVVEGELWGPRGIVALFTQVKMVATTGPSSVK